MTEPEVEPRPPQKPAAPKPDTDEFEILSEQEK